MRDDWYRLERQIEVELYALYRSETKDPLEALVKRAVAMVKIFFDQSLDKDRLISKLGDQLQADDLTRALAAFREADEQKLCLEEIQIGNTRVRRRG